MRQLPKVLKPGTDRGIGIDQTVPTILGRVYETDHLRRSSGSSDLVPTRWGVRKANSSNYGVSVPGETLLTFSGVTRFMGRPVTVGEAPYRTKLRKFLLAPICMKSSLPPRSVTASS